MPTSAHVRHARIEPVFDRSVRADGGGIAAGRDVNIEGVSEAALVQLVTLAKSPEAADHAELAQRLDALLPETSRVTPQALAAFFRILGERNLPPEQLGARLETIAASYVEIQTRLRALSNDDPEVAALRREAAGLIEAGDFDAARAKLVEASERDRAAQEELEERARARRSSRAASEAELGDLAKLRLAYRDAAGHYATGRDLLRGHAGAAAAYAAMKLGDALRNLAEQMSDSTIFREAVDAYDEALFLLPNGEKCKRRFSILMRLAEALEALGETLTGISELERAALVYGQLIASLRSEDNERTAAYYRKRLARLFSKLSDRTGNTDFLERASFCLRHASPHFSRGRVHRGLRSAKV